MFYVSVVDAGRTGLVLGPFETEAECRTWAYSKPEDGGDWDKHNRLVKATCNMEPRAWFYAWGMVRMENGNAVGRMNHIVKVWK